ncbi:MAG TPA: YdeI/OmpD-associated family protein [Burkholderiaceae bacterium]|nr:YdeI/OmpD-associated family protein [Burkholderiaceae bacterium]
MAASQDAAPKVRFFRAPPRWRNWLEKNHAKAAELWVGFYKRGSGKPSMTWPESVDEALCFGWIDAVRKSIDGERYKIRFTRRKPGSIWSAVNVRRVAALRTEGRMRPAGEAAFAVRKANRSGIYAYEQRPAELTEPWLGLLKKNKAAWKFFAAQPPWYRRTTTWWVISAKREETRRKRFDRLVQDSASGLWLAQLRRTPQT